MLKLGVIYLRVGRRIGDRTVGKCISRLFPGRRAVHTIPAVSHFSNARRDTCRSAARRRSVHADQARTYVYILPQLVLIYSTAIDIKQVRCISIYFLHL